MKTPLVEVKNISLTLSGQTILKDISLEIYPNEIVSLIGPNGAGKTTLLKVLLGLYTPQKGRVNMHTNRIGYVPQKLFFDHTIPLSVEEFLSTYSAEPKKIILKELAEVGAEDLIEKRIGDLSGGQLQRVLVANALLQHPQILLLDEPATGIDVIGEQQLYELISHIHEQHRATVVMVSHDIHAVFARSTRVFCLQQKMCCSGKPKDISRDPEFHKVFGKYFVPYPHKHSRE